MNRLDYLSGDKKVLYESFMDLYNTLSDGFLQDLDRLPALSDLFVDRWERAAKLGFGAQTNIYDNALVIGKVKVGRECWVGPNTILDGSGGLEIGDYCTISAGVQVYSHDNVAQTLSGKQIPIVTKHVTIGNRVYVGPQSVIVKGVTIGDCCIIGAFAFVNKDVPSNSIVIGQPAKVVGNVFMVDGKLEIKYF